MNRAMTNMNVVRQRHAFVLRFFQYEKTFPRNGVTKGLRRREGDASTWKVSDFMEDGMDIFRD